MNICIKRDYKDQTFGDNFRSHAVLMNIALVNIGSCAATSVFSVSLCHVWHACHILQLCRICAALWAAGKIPESWTPCGTDTAITACNPSGAGMGRAVWGCGSLLTLLAGGAWSWLSLSGPQGQLLKSNWKARIPVYSSFSTIKEWHIWLGKGFFSSSVKKRQKYKILQMWPQKRT